MARERSTPLIREAGGSYSAASRKVIAPPLPKDQGLKVLDISAARLWLKFTFPKEIVPLTEGGPLPGEEKMLENLAGKVAGKVAGKIIELIRENLAITIPELAQALKKLERMTERLLHTLKSEQSSSRPKRTPRQALPELARG